MTLSCVITFGLFLIGDVIHKAIKRQEPESTAAEQFSLISAGITQNIFSTEVCPFSPIF